MMSSSTTPRMAWATRGPGARRTRTMARSEVTAGSAALLLGHMNRPCGPVKGTRWVQRPYRAPADIRYCIGIHPDRRRRRGEPSDQERQGQDEKRSVSHQIPPISRWRERSLRLLCSAKTSSALAGLTFRPPCGVCAFLGIKDRPPNPTDAFQPQTVPNQVPGGPGNGGTLRVLFRAQLQFGGFFSIELPFPAPCTNVRQASEIQT